MYELKTSASFDSAHFLAGYQGKCANLHGHHWQIEVIIKGDSLQENGQQRGMLLDFGDLKKAVRDLADSFDHALIYEAHTLKAKTIEALTEEHFRLIPVPFRPTAENFAKYFFEALQMLPIYQVTVWETPDNCAVYRHE